MQKKKEPFTLWVRGPNGKPSISATFATVSFFTTTFVYVISIFEKIGPYAIRPFDAAACGIYLVPIMSLYFGRRWTDSRFASMGQYGNQYGNQYGGYQGGQFGGGGGGVQITGGFNAGSFQNNQGSSAQSSTVGGNQSHPTAPFHDDDSHHFKGVVEEGSDEDNGN